MPATRRSGASIKEESYGEIPMMKTESYGENLRAMDVSDPAVADLGTLASGSSDDLVIDPAAVSAALADQLDDSVMRDALFTLGFDEIPPMSFTMDAAADDADIDTNDGKKARTTGANQRAVQKRYRERKKQHTASLEAKVAELQSRIDDLEAWLDHLALDAPITLVAHDWGGMIAMGWAVRHPERVASITLMNTAAFHLPDDMKIPPSLAFVRKTALASWMVRHLSVPFGGLKNSGLGREGGMHSLRFFSEDKNIYIDYGTPP